MSQNRISVVIPVRNEADNIEKCLQAVFSQSLAPHEVIIVDGHSTDGTVKRAGKFPVKIFYEDNCSIACGRQIGLEKAQGEFIAFTDADCIPDKDWLKNLIKEISEGIIGVGGAAKNVGDGLVTHSVHLALDTFLGSGRSPQGRFFKTKRFVESIGGFSSIYRREDLLAEGGFNTRLPVGEDLELNRRLCKKGRLLYTPEAIVLHHHDWTLKGFAKKIYRYGRERGIIRACNLQVIPPLAVPLLVLSLIFTRWIFIPLLILYLVCLMSLGLKFSIQERNTRYLATIPLVYLLEHMLYSIGFWKGLIMSLTVR